MSAVITYDDLMAAVGGAKPARVEGLSVSELCSRSGLSRATVLRLIRHAGDRVKVGHRRVEAIDGRAQWIPVYRFTK